MQEDRKSSRSGKARCQAKEKRKVTNVRSFLNATPPSALVEVFETCRAVGVLSSTDSTTSSNLKYILEVPDWPAVEEIRMKAQSGRISSAGREGGSWIEKGKS